MQTACEIQQTYVVGVQRGRTEIRVFRAAEAADVIVIASNFQTEGDAQDYRDEQQARCDQLNASHCDTCG